MIIDFHTHTFPSASSVRILEGLSHTGHVLPFTDGSAEGLSRSMQQACVDLSVNLPVMTRADQVSKVNDSLIKRKEELADLNIITFGGLHPDFEDLKEEIRKLKNNGIKGVKMHPAFQGKDINDPAYKRIIGMLSEEGLICTIHCGWDSSFQEHNYASVPMLLDLIDDVRPVNLILAHMGCLLYWDEVEKDLAGANVWMDTAYSLGPMHPVPGTEDLLDAVENMSDEQFVRLIRAHGPEKVLFATDSPWMPQDDYVRRVKACGLTEEELKLVLGENARGLLGV